MAEEEDDGGLAKQCNERFGRGEYQSSIVKLRGTLHTSTQVFGHHSSLCLSPGQHYFLDPLNDMLRQQPSVAGNSNPMPPAPEAAQRPLATTQVVPPSQPTLVARGTPAPPMLPALAATPMLPHYGGSHGMRKRDRESASPQGSHGEHRTAAGYTNFDG